MPSSARKPWFCCAASPKGDAQSAETFRVEDTIRRILRAYGIECEVFAIPNCLTISFEAANGNGEKVVPVSTADYYAGAEGPVAPRPVHSALDLSKLEAAGFHMPEWEEELRLYTKALL